MIYSKDKQLNNKVINILRTIKRLESNDRYRAMLVFGSAARGEFVEDSDIDIKVIIKGEEHPEVNHPVINGVKIDISFNLIETLRKDTKQELDDGKRVPIVAESIILFDKDGELKQLAKYANTNKKPIKYKESKYNWVRFVILNEDIKVKRNIKTNLTNANYIMHTGLEDMIKMYYKIKGKWQHSNKKTLKDLYSWDPTLHSIVTNLVNSSGTVRKYEYWTAMIDYILKDIGDRSNIEETSCNCKRCQKDTRFLLSLLYKNID